MQLGLGNSRNETDHTLKPTKNCLTKSLFISNNVCVCVREVAKEKRSKCNRTWFNSAQECGINEHFMIMSVTIT